MATYVAPSAIVHEVLKKDNYEYWSACMESYLELQDLWETISSGPSEDETKSRVWQKKNLAALHAIQISCGPEFFSEIKNIRWANFAWEALAKKLDRQPQGSENLVEQVPETIELPVQKDELIRCITTGNWEQLKASLAKHSSLINARIGKNRGTALHCAVKYRQLRVVEGLVGMMKPEDLAVKDKRGITALVCAAWGGVTEMVRCMIGKNEKLATIVSGKDIPLSNACKSGHKDTASYLYTKTSIDFLSQENGKHASRVIWSCIYGETLDIALDLLHRLPDEYKVDVIKNSHVLVLLSRKPGVFPSGLKLAFWQRLIYSNVRVPEFVPSTGTLQIDIDLRRIVIDENPSKIGKIFLQVLHRLRRLRVHLLDILGVEQIRDMKHEHVRSVDLVKYICKKIRDLDVQMYHDIGMYDAFSSAIKLGISELVFKLIKIHTNLFYYDDDNGRNYQMLSVIHRQEKIFGRIAFYVRKGHKFGNTLLHLAGLLSPPSRLTRFSGAALQMQRELQWYKEVESLTDPKYKEEQNSDGETPSQVFTKSHKELMAEGEKWMKDTATSCTVVGALIITIMFTAIFTIPGGNQNTGLPLFLQRASFRVFIISDAISLFASSTSVMTFLGILTARYAEQDFYRSLPTQLIVGLSSLFLSIATMMTAFCATLFIILDGEWSYVVPITSLAAAPVIQFMFSHFALLVDVVKTTYGRSIFYYKKSPK